MTTGFVRALVRLFAVQGSWNYERMTGVGMGHAAEPLLEDLKSADPVRHAEAMVRSAEYFNSHPYLAGLAVGALARAEYDQVPAAQMGRLRTALTSPLGALGDQLFWIGLVPVVMGGAIMGVVAGHWALALGLALLVYNGIRLATGVWALRTGLATGARVGAAIGASWLPRAAPVMGLGAGLLVGIAMPLAADWLLEDQAGGQIVLAISTMLLALVAGWKYSPLITSVRFGLVVLTLAALLALGLP